MEQTAKAILGLMAAAGIGLGIWYATRTPHEGRIAPADGRGDVDMDGWVTQADVNLIQQIILGTFTPTAEQFRRADIKVDGLVNAIDLVATKRYIDLGELP